MKYLRRELNQVEKEYLKQLIKMINKVLYFNYNLLILPFIHKHQKSWYPSSYNTFKYS